MSHEGQTRWVVERRRYFLERWKHGVAELVRAERRDETAWVRVLEAVYWWPKHEGREWPAIVIPGPERTGEGFEPDTWEHFEAALGMDQRYRWEGVSDPSAPE